MCVVGQAKLALALCVSGEAWWKRGKETRINGIKAKNRGERGIKL